MCVVEFEQMRYDLKHNSLSKRLTALAKYNSKIYLIRICILFLCKSHIYLSIKAKRNGGMCT